MSYVKMDLLSVMERLLELRSFINQQIEVYNKTHSSKVSSGNIAVFLTLPDEDISVVSFYGAEVLRYPILELAAGELACTVRRVSGPKCARCWRHMPYGDTPGHPTLCPRCGLVVLDWLQDKGYPPVDKLDQNQCTQCRKTVLAEDFGGDPDYPTFCNTCAKETSDWLREYPNTELQILWEDS